MDRIWESGASASPPTAPASPSSGYPIAGNPATGTPATTPGPWWYHMVTEEMRAVITAAGLTPDHTNLGQLLTALQAMGLRDATETLKGRVELATSAEVTDGTDAVRAVTPAGLLAGLLGSGGVGVSDYIKIPFRDKTSGARRELIVQWFTVEGTVTTSVRTLTATLPVAFPNANFRVFFTRCEIELFVSASPVYDFIAGSKSLTSASVIAVRSSGSGNTRFNGLAIGY